MARLKQMLKSALEDRSPRFVLGTIALAVVVSLVAGFAIGYKVENSRGKPAKKAATAKKKPTKKKPTRKLSVKGGAQLVGGVFAVRPRQLVVLGASGKPVRIGIGNKTRVAVAEKDKASSIVVGSHVLYQPSPTSSTRAVEVVVLPATAPIGVPVTAVVPGTSMSLKSLTGKDTVITTTGAAVETTRSGTRRNISKRSKVIVHYFVVRKRNAAIEVVVLPTGSKFH